MNGSIKPNWPFARRRARSRRIFIAPKSRDRVREESMIPLHAQKRIRPLDYCAKKRHIKVSFVGGIDSPFPNKKKTLPWGFAKRIKRFAGNILAGKIEASTGAAREYRENFRIMFCRRCVSAGARTHIRQVINVRAARGVTALVGTHIIHNMHPKASLRPPCRT